jgi:hypothetical protein
MTKEGRWKKVPLGKFNKWRTRVHAESSPSRKFCTLRKTSCAANLPTKSNTNIVSVIIWLRTGGCSRAGHCSYNWKAAPRTSTVLRIPWRSTRAPSQITGAIAAVVVTRFCSRSLSRGQWSAAHGCTGVISHWSKFYSWRMISCTPIVFTESNTNIASVSRRSQKGYVLQGNHACVFGELLCSVCIDLQGTGSAWFPAITSSLRKHRLVHVWRSSFLCSRHVILLAVVPELNSVSPSQVAINMVRKNLSYFFNCMQIQFLFITTMVRKVLSYNFYFLLMQFMVLLNIIAHPQF